MTDAAEEIYRQYGTAVLMLVALATVLYVYACQWLVHLQTKQPFADLPMAANSHWFFGHVKIIYDKDNFPESLYKVVHDAADDHGRTGYWLGSKKTISVLRLEDARTVLKVESHRTSVPVVSRYVGRVIGPKNLLFLNGREWRRHRDAVTRTFVPSFLVQAQQDVWEVSRALVQTLQQKIAENTSSNYTTNVQPIMKMVTMDVIGKAAFSTDFECCQKLQPAPVVQAFEFLTKDLTVRLGNPVHPCHFFFGLPTEQNRKQAEQLAILQTFIGDLLSKAQAMSQDSPATTDGKHTKDKSNLLMRLVAAHANMDKKHSDQNDDASDLLMDNTLRDVMATLLFASYDTTSTTLMFCLYLLAIHPAIQQECVEEIRSLGDNTQLSNPDDLVYCTAVVRETLRLYPPGFIVSRTLTKPVPLSGGFVAPEGAHVVIPVWVIQRDETIFPRPEECLPERWAQRSSNDGNKSRWVPRNQHTEEMTDASSSIPAGNLDGILAFSGGGRNCPGAKFAMQEAVIVLANLVKDLKFYPVPNFQLKLQLEGILPYPSEGMPLRIEKR